MENTIAFLAKYFGVTKGTIRNSKKQYLAKLSTAFVYSIAALPKVWPQGFIRSIDSLMNILIKEDKFFGNYNEEYIKNVLRKVIKDFPNLDTFWIYEKDGCPVQPKPSVQKRIEEIMAKPISLYSKIKTIQNWFGLTSKKAYKWGTAVPHLIPIEKYIEDNNLTYEDFVLNFEELCSKEEAKGNTLSIKGLLRP